MVLMKMAGSWWRVVIDWVVVIIAFVSVDAKRVQETEREEGKGPNVNNGLVRAAGKDVTR